MATALWGPLNIDGQFGPLTQEYLQRMLRHRGHYTGLLDGKFGSMSVKALQKTMSIVPNAYYFGAIDGIAGKMTWESWFDYLKGQGPYWDGGNVWDSGKIPQNIGYGTTVMTQKMLNNYRIHRQVQAV